MQQYEEDDESAVLAPSRPSRPQPGGGFPAPSRPAPAPAPGGDEEEHNPAPEPYQFSYSVNDEESGSQLSREESQDAAGNIVGKYCARRRWVCLVNTEWCGSP